MLLSVHYVHDKLMLGEWRGREGEEKNMSKNVQLFKTIKHEKFLSKNDKECNL